jgi:hypothetical protein
MPSLLERLRQNTVVSTDRAKIVEKRERQKRPAAPGKAWVRRIFKAQAVRRGEIVRRSVDSVLKFSTEAELKAEVQARGYHMVRVNNQYVIYCTPHTEWIC